MGKRINQILMYVRQEIGTTVVIHSIRFLDSILDLNVIESIPDTDLNAEIEDGHRPGADHWDTSLSVDCIVIEVDGDRRN